RWCAWQAPWWGGVRRVGGAENGGQRVHVGQGDQLLAVVAREAGLGLPEEVVRGGGGQAQALGGLGDGDAGLGGGGGGGVHVNNVHRNTLARKKKGANVSQRTRSGDLRDWTVGVAAAPGGGQGRRGAAGLRIGVHALQHVQQLLLPGFDGVVNGGVERLVVDGGGGGHGVLLVGWWGWNARRRGWWCSPPGCWGSAGGGGRVVAGAHRDGGLAGVLCLDGRSVGRVQAVGAAGVGGPGGVEGAEGGEDGGGGGGGHGWCSLAGVLPRWLPG